jgi:uncharacterized protein YyaL (SSP411 family)
MPNRLAKETSPYLLQHAENPVDWYPWGEEALKRAGEEDKPIFLSIGYSSCHWCHVMAHESFENEGIASLLNQDFISIKVDREERPDIDGIYMDAVQSMTGGGGWPLTVFLTPEGKPFHGGTYFPPEDKHGLPGLPSVLKSVTDAYSNHRDDIEKLTGKLSLSATHNLRTEETEQLVPDIIRQAFFVLKRTFDSRNGGFGTAPKFPQPLLLELLLRYYQRSQVPSTLEMVQITLDKMARGGIYDQLGGGFHRYSTDAVWLAPHFEKMLYDNALLSHVYLHAYLLTGKSLYRTIVEETLDYVLREMTAPKGGFYSSQDADSEGVEGKYFLWTVEQIGSALDRKALPSIVSYFGVTRDGNFEGKNILHVANEPDRDIEQLIKEAKVALLQEREKRVKPERDEKILASWNAMMLASITEAACALIRKDYLDTAVASGTFLLKQMMPEGRLKHVYKDGKAKIDGFLQDYALVIEAFLGLHLATFKGEWLKQAIKLADDMIEQFWDTDSGIFYDTGSRHEQLFVRPRHIFDEVIPCGASAATQVLLKLARMTDSGKYEQVALQSLRSMSEIMGKQPFGTASWLCALDFYLSPPMEVAIVGSKDSTPAQELLHALCTVYLPSKIAAAYDPKDRSKHTSLKLLQDRSLVDGKPAVYICQNFACDMPITDPATLTANLKGE